MQSHYLDRHVYDKKNIGNAGNDAIDRLQLANIDQLASLNIKSLGIQPLLAFSSIFMHEQTEEPAQKMFSTVFVESELAGGAGKLTCFKNMIALLSENGEQKIEDSLLVCLSDFIMLSNNYRNQITTEPEICSQYVDPIMKKLFAGFHEGFYAAGENSKISDNMER
ncbi:hypothetical protein BD408DRAFT_486157, partial [Parasitella parasitica]